MVLAILASLGNFTSCSTDDDGGGNGAAGDGLLEAKVDGASFKSFAQSSSATVANDGNNLIIIASSTDANGFAMTIFGYDGVGTYPLGGGANIFNVASYSETDVDLNNPTNSTTELWQAPYDDTVVGEIRISEETDSKIKGTFEFRGKNVNGDGSFKEITNGSFNLKKQTN